MQYLPPPSNLKPGSTVWTYLRDSGGEGQDRSVARQEETIRAYCLKYDLILDDRFIFRDVAKSGKSIAGREEFNRMIELSEDRSIRPHAIILWNYARFARNASQAIYFISMLRNRGIVVYSITDPIPDSKYSIIIEDSIHIGNEERREQISRDVKEQLHQLVTNYGAMFGRPPTGIKREPLDVTIPNPRTGKVRTLNKWIPDPDYIPLIRKAFTMRANGESYQRIGLATGLFASDNSWTTFFANPIYKGALEYGGMVIENYCEPIVSPELWQAVQLLNRRRARPKSGGADNPRRVGSSFILSGKIFCQNCGSPMNGYSIKRWDYYACSRRRRRHDCDARRIPRDALEQAVIEQLLEQLLSLESLLAIQIRMQEAYNKARSSTQQERLELDRKLRAAKKKVSNLTNAIAARGHSKALLAALDEAETDENELLLQLSALEQASRVPPKYDRPSLAQLAEWVSQELRGTRDQQRYILQSIITRVIAKRDDTHIVAAVYYIPPQLAFESQIASPNDREGNKAYGNMPPRGYSTEDLIINLFIPVRKHKAPLPR